LSEGSKTGLTYFYYHAILKKETRDSMRQTIPEGRYVPNSQIKLPIEILDDDVYQPFIDEYKSMHANPMGVDRARLEGFTGGPGVNIDIEHVAYFNLDKWNSYKANIRQSRITRIFYNTIIRLCGGCIHCFWMEDNDAYYHERFQMHMLPALGLPRCEYHHINEDRKLYNISDMDTMSPTEVLLELRKVVCLCYRHHKYISTNRPTPEGANAQDILDSFLLEREYHADELTGVLTPNEDE
jgi:hypothetical protein